jgi:hypothetical protein
MCSPVEILGALLFVLLLVLVVRGLVHESRLVGYVEERHPKLWAELANRGKRLIPEDGNYSYAGVQWYLILCGAYRQIEDPVAQHLGKVARRWSLAAIACIVVFGLVVMSLQAFPSLKCLVPRL